MVPKFPISVVINGIDKVSVPMRNARKNIDKLFAPLRTLKDKVGEFSKVSGLPELKAGFVGFGSSIAEVGRELFGVIKKGAMFAGVIGGAVTAIVISFAHAGDEISKTSQKLGIDAVALQEWRYAADQANVDAGDFDQGVLQLTRRLGLFGQGNKAAAAPFARLRVHVLDANDKLRSASELLPEIANAFTKLRDPQDAVNLSMQLFGKSGAAMLPMLKVGSAELARMRVEAHALGLVMSDEDAAAGDAFMDTLHQAQGAVQGIRNAIGSALLPILRDLLQSFTRFVVENRPQIVAFANAFAQKLPGVLADLWAQFQKLWVILQPLINTFRLAVDVLGPLPVIIGVVGAAILALMLPAMLSLTVSFYSLGVAIATTPAGWILLAVVAIAAALVGLVVGVIALWRNWDRIWGAIKRIAAAVWGWIEENLDFIPIVYVIKNWDKLRVYFAFVWTAVLGYFRRAWEWIKSNWTLLIGPVGLIIRHWTKVRDFFTDLWDTVKLAFRVGVQFAIAQVQTLTSFLPDWLQEKLGLRAELGAARGTAAPDRQLTSAASSSSAAAVSVSFDNLPAGARVREEENSGVDLDVSMGFSHAGG